MIWLPLLILGLVSLIGGVASTVATNSSNASAVNATNTANKEMNAENNRVLQQESAKSLYNSLPTTQVRNMVAAGMSKYGALAALDNGGSYVPAPVVSARNESAKYDYSGIGNAMSDLTGLGSQLNTTRMQIEAQERMNAATNDTNLEIARLNAQANRSNIEDTNFTNFVDASERAKYSSLVQSLQKYIQDAPKDKMSYYGIRSIIPDSLRSEMDSLSPATQRVLGDWISSQGAASSEARKTQDTETLLSETRISQHIENTNKAMDTIIKQGQIALNDETVKLTRKQREQVEEAIKFAKQTREFNEKYNAEQLGLIKKDIELRSENIYTERFKRSMETIHQQIEYMEFMRSKHGFSATAFGLDFGFETSGDIEPFANFETLKTIYDAYVNATK